MAASSIPPKTWGTYGWGMLGLSIAYAEVTRRLRGFYLHYIAGNFSIYNPLNLGKQFGPVTDRLRPTMEKSEKT